MNQQIPGAVNCPALALSPTVSNAPSIPGTNSWSDSAQAYTQNAAVTGCLAGAVSAAWQATCTALSCTGGYCGDDDDDDDDCSENGNSCDFDSDCCSGNCEDGTCENLDPIIIDLTGRGYQLTTAADGVRFDFFGTGAPIKMSWTASGWTGGFLALDRNGNGRIDNATELFSNITAQAGPPAKGANGFLALEAYDLPANGGNGDGWIDEHDTVYSKLRIWIDSNHNGISEPEELLTLKQAGVQAIAVTYTNTQWKDSFGNMFRYSAPLRTRLSQNQLVYDVLLQQAGRTRRFSTISDATR